jgi:hypothetical protein
MTHKIVDELLVLLKEESKKFDGQISYAFITGYLLSMLDNMIDKKPDVLSVLVEEHTMLFKKL